MEYIGSQPKTKPNQTSEGAIFIIIDADDLKSRRTNLRIDVLSDDEILDQTSTTFYGPVK